MDGVDGLDGEVFGRYRLLEVLRSGSTGTVYKAHDTMMSRDVAIKVLLPELVAEPGYAGAVPAGGLHRGPAQRPEHHPDL